MDQREKFIRHWKRRDMPFARLCEAYGISRKTGYKWLGRYDEGGIAGLADRSRAPLTSPQAIDEDVRDLLVRIRFKHPFWGPRKVLWWLEKHRPDVPRPAPSTVGELFKKRGLVRARRRRIRLPPRTQPFEAITAPNDTWCTDFKGEFRVGDGETCYPLTITDAFSRYLIRAHGLASTATGTAQRVFRAAFDEYGLPNTIRSDNGQPFGAPAAGSRALSRLGVWFIRLGIRPERTAPGSPEENGRHERMHWTLKQETALPPRSSFSEQQRAFDRFQAEYNHERPHEALDGATPVTLYRPSPRPFPRHLPEIAYPTPFTVRRARRSGEISWNADRVFLSEVLTGEPVGLLEHQDGSWEVFFGPMSLGFIGMHGTYVPRETPMWAPEYAQAHA